MARSVQADGGCFDVFLGLLEEGVDAVHSLNGGFEALVEGGEIAAEEGQDAEYGFSCIEGGVAAVEVGGLELPLLDFEEVRGQFAVDLLGFGEGFVREGGEVLLELGHVGDAGVDAFGGEVG